MTETNRTFEELKVGDAAEARRVCTVDDFIVFANVSGNHNPMHLPDYDGDGDGEPEAVAPSMLVGSLISAVLGNTLPGPGTLYRSQTLKFHGRAEAGDELVVRVEVTEKHDDGTVRMHCEVTNSASGEAIVTGEADVIAPTRKLSFDDLVLPTLMLQRHTHYDRALELACRLPPAPVAVVAPEEPQSLGGALIAGEKGMIAPILIGDRAKMEAAAAELGRSLDGVEVIEESSHPAAARIACQLVNERRAKAIMKGHLHTDELLKAVLAKEGGLRAGRRLTHVFVMDVPGVSHPVLVTDAAINIAPDIQTKVDIVQNAIDLAHSLGLKEPKVGILSAVETVNPAIESSVHGAILSKMAERGQITGGIVDGPLAMDNAVDLAAAQTKGIVSPVAGRAEVLVVPDLDAGNMLAKQLTFVAGAEAGGVVMGARCPIILTSRSDDERARLLSCAVVALHSARLAGIDVFAEEAAE